VVIPLSLLFALACMYLSGVLLSLLSIGALDFGIIVDATIVMVERMLHRLADRGEALQRMRFSSASGSPRTRSSGPCSSRSSSSSQRTFPC
jgi:Cu/Ag efflux pump CusA